MPKSSDTSLDILLVWTHPMPDSYSAALRDQTLSVLTPNHRVELLDLYKSGFATGSTARYKPVGEESASREASSQEPSMEEIMSLHREKLLAAKAVVLVYPTWWDGLPAILKSWLEHLLPGALDSKVGKQKADNYTRHIRDLVVLTTHGSSRRVNFVQGRTGRMLLMKSLRRLCHPNCRSRWIALYRIDRTTEKQRQDFLKHTAKQLQHHFG